MLRTTLKHCWRALRTLLDILVRHRSMGIAAEMSFWLFCSLIPLAVTALIILARLPDEETASLTGFFSAVPVATRALVVKEVAELSHHQLQPSLLNLVVFVWLASTGIHAIYDGFEAQLGIATPWWKKRLRALLGCAALSIGVALLALLGTGMTHLSGFAHVLVGRRLGFVLRSASALLVLYGLVAGLYRLGIPTSARRQLPLAPGTLGVVVLIGTAGVGYRAYLATVGDGSLYQAGLAVVVVTLTALFLFSLAMLLGLAINQQIAQRVRPLASGKKASPSNGRT